MKQDLEQELSKLVSNYCGFDVKVELAATAEQFGDYSTNIAMKLAGKLGKSPIEVAEAVKSVAENIDYVKAVEVAKPGFINIILSDEKLLSGLENGLKPSKPLAGKITLVEYSDPNPFKPLHAGHLYTTLVGDIIARLLENAGAEVKRLNFGGDVGLHVAKSMWAIIKNFGGEDSSKLAEINEADRAAWMGIRYVEGNNAYEDNEQSRSEITLINKRVYEIHNSHDHDSDFAKIYWACRQWSYDYFSKLYEQLQVKAFDRFIPESEVAELGLKTVQQQKESGVYQESDGAVIFKGEVYGLHDRVFINSEGLPTYEAKDIGLALTKWHDYHFDSSVIITANEQAQYMQVVIKSLEQFEPEPALRTHHLTHGVVKLSGGVKMSSRKGNIVSALDILQAARAAGEASGTASNEETILAAVKYAFAKNRIGGDIVYDPAESVALEGNSGPYLQYAHARACSILEKAKNAPPDRMYNFELNESERKLVLKMNEYNQVIVKATKEMMPHYICTFLFELAQEFNRFYEKNKVLGSEQEIGRLQLVGSYKHILSNGLELLGIHAPERM